MMETDLGTTYKLNIHIDGLPGTMDDVEFSCRFWTWRDSITIQKEEMIRLDADNYLAVIDSKLIGRGTIKVQTTVSVPDGDCPGGLRTEIYTEETGIKIK